MATYNFKKQAELYLYPTIDVESGLTLSEEQPAFTQIGATGAFATTQRGQKVVMAGELQLNTTNINSGDEVIFEHGGSGYGTWIGRRAMNPNKLHFRTGVGTNTVTETGNEGIVVSIALSDIPEFDNSPHTICWEIDPPNGTAKLWIDNRLIFSETTSDGSSFTSWSGSNPGGWLQGFEGIAGAASGSQYESERRSAWSGNTSVNSKLRVYTNQSVEYDNAPVRLDVGEDITFNQTFTDDAFEQRTLHAPNKLHEQSNIKKANPANFEFTIPALVENDLRTVVQLLLDYDSSGHSLNTFDLYIKLPNDVYKIEKCVITNGTFIIEKLENLKLGIQGQGTRLTRGASFPGGVTARSSTRTFQLIDLLTVSIDGTSLTEGIYSATIELQNDIKWNPYTTLNDALSVTNANTSMYPSNFTLDKRILSGSIGQYVLSNFNSDVQTWKTGINISITAGKSQTQGFQFSLNNCTFTNRNEVSEVFTQRYDFRMNDNPTDLGDKTTGSYITFNNI